MIPSRMARKSGTLSKADYEALAQFRYVLRKFMGFSEEAAREAGLSARQHQALLAIYGFPGREHLTMGELAERLHVRHHSAVGLVDRLCARGLLRRRRDPLDRRRVQVELSTKGRSSLSALSLSHHDELRRLAPVLKRLLTQLEGVPNGRNDDTGR